MTAVSTSTAQHGMHGSISFTQSHSLNFNQAYEDDEVSPTTAFFPTHAVPKPASPGPLPNPPFVFPARRSPSSAPPSISRGNMRGFSLPSLEQSDRDEKDNERRNSRNRPPPLPSFNFGPASPTTSHQNSPISPLTTTMPIITRPGGHRRGGSEFIGGDGTTGNGTLLSSSPANGEAELPTPSSAGPPTGRRGHAHRRSAAVSCHDLSMMLKPPAGSSSAPTSPSGMDYKRSSFPNTLDTSVNLRLRAHCSQPSSPEKLSNRARVGFSDTLEFIPRPLSLATSESSSIATTKQGHSVSNSLSSIVSINAAVRSSRDIARYPSPPLSDKGQQNVRPKTAGAILGGPMNNVPTPEDQMKVSQPVQNDVPVEKTGSPSTPKFPGKKYIFFGHESLSSEASPTRSRPASPASTSQSAAESLPQQDIPVADVVANSIEAPASRQRRSSITKKTKKAKKWSILPRKTRSRSGSIKQQKALSRRSPTPPLRHYPSLETESTTPVIEVDAPSPSRNQFQTDIASWRPRQVSTQDDDSMSPIIDLDAALGPFNTPTGRDLEWEASQRGSGLRKRRMHSAATLGGFGTPYHRRAESAPQMAAFENSRMSIHHLGSSSTMADVFEEDEEDDEWEETKSVSRKESKSELDEEEGYASPGVEVVDAVDMHDGKFMDWSVESDESVQRGVKRKGSGLSDSHRRQTNSSLSSKKSITSLNEQGGEESSRYPDMLPPSPKSGGKYSDSTMTPPLYPSAAKNLPPVDIGSSMLRERYLAPSSVPSEDLSPFPSPRSPFSYDDTQRISTAPSSLIAEEDRSFHSLLLGEPGPELRMSVDEVPSLTSSSSTMTGTFNFPPGSLFMNAAPAIDGTSPFRDGQRSASLSAAAVSRKRSSIASLSRLINTSHGEKSKLSIEQQAPPSPEGKKEKGSRGKRFSRKLQFWKSKNDPAPS